MKTFLQYVAEDIIRKHGTDLSRMAVVFPNKRASLFFNEYLARAAGKPLWSPAYITISELFRQHSTLQVADPIKLVCDLHKCFTACTGSKETPDQFFGWGQVLLADFDDIDKNMANADKVFANLRDIHELDDVSYLTEEQKRILRQFFGNFAENQQSELKKRFLNLWSHFIDIYHRYNDCLQQQQLAYEGALYRQVALDEKVDFEYDTYIFIGFNLLQQVEQRLFERLKKAGKARFYWDFDHYYMPRDDGKANEAGYYIAQHLQQFPNELDTNADEIYRNFLCNKQLTYMAATTENIQARYIADWLSENKRITDGKRTAIVLCDENLLPSVIHCLPNEVKKVNITTGYPLIQSPVTSFVLQLLTLQTVGKTANGRYRLKFVNRVLRHPYASYLSDNVQELLDNLNKNHIYYVASEQLESLHLVPSTSNPPFSPLHQYTRWLTDVLGIVACSVRERTAEADRDPLFTESLFRMYTLLNRLNDLVGSGDLNVEVPTLQRLLTQLIQSTTVPFHGEPAVGLQVMGVLETRNLDFDHLLILSCNEGNIPRGVNDTSFIPYSIRKAYGLTTIDHKVAIYSYYFHRLLQRAKDVTLVYNNATEDGKTGEMSRFMLQMMVESGHSIEHQTLQANKTPSLSQTPTTINKTPKVMSRLLKRFAKSPETKDDVPLLTPSAINRYMRCQLQFYYNYVCGLRETDNDEEDTIDGRTFGNIFHEAAHRIYEQLGFHITVPPLEYLLKQRKNIEDAVDKAIKKELLKIKDSDKMPELNGLQIINRAVIIRYLRQLLETDKALAPFSILGLEKTVSRTWQVNSGTTSFQTTIGGTIDRLDNLQRPANDVVRVVDYKTGGGTVDSLPDVEAIFETENIGKKHSEYYLQTFIYGLIVSASKEYNDKQSPVIPALFFVQHAAKEDYSPVLKMAGEEITNMETFRQEFEEHLSSLINEIFNPDIPFHPTANSTNCANCPYAQLCKGTK